ncbi:hypothetical protein PY199_002480 [Vibrio cholerae]|uniref:hypothetical protein n=1 Tax=Vibrio cholerae TaxID=666 RepID=UPI000B48B076|nr:hypothetical protein [Vibrio cholerae]EGR4458266.1 hypothetical protein [Vibrio cholerae]EGR5448062.1 hypothetical protein [Vibrio cholerae]EGR5456059.1 hypothetical protein [Vibrio cholerae]EGR5464090.1 hypothetical protein [Vibrio cholerae]EKN8282703.1 hypothetical protein [Vibrio cholerae]
MKNILDKLKRSIKLKFERFTQAYSDSVKVSGYLYLARTALDQKEFITALDKYLLIRNLNAQVLESYIGAAICHIQLDNHSDAIEVLNDAHINFGDHDAILGLITRCKLHERSWVDVETYWRKWKKSFQQHPNLDFYQASGEVLVSLMKTESIRKEFSDELFSELIFQDDITVDSKSHPVICQLLFHHHEYDRQFYLYLLENIRSYLIKQKNKKVIDNLCYATMLLTFGLVNKDERANLLKTHFYKFDLYSHWSFVLIGSSYNAVWDQSLKDNLESIPIITEVLRNSSKRLDALGADDTFKMIFLASICCQDITPTLIEHARQMLIQDGVNEDIRDDLAFIAWKFKKLVKEKKNNIKPRLKLAVCVSGQLRGWENAFRSWKKIGFGDCDVTYIVHTWKDSGGGAPIPPKDERALPIAFQKVFRSTWNKIGEEKMLSQYPEFFSMWPQSGTEVEVCDLKRVYGTEHVYVDDDSIEPFRNMSNSEKMYYKISECQKVADNIGIDFDLIVRIRPDLEFIDNKQIDWHGIYQDCTYRRVLFCEAYSNYFFPGIGFCMPDHFAIASPDVMRGYASAYEMTKKHSSSENFNLTQFPQDFIAHRNVAYSTIYNGAIVESIALPCRFSPAFKPSKEMILKAIRQDATGRNNAFDEILINAL